MTEFTDDDLKEFKLWKEMKGNISGITMKSPTETLPKKPKRPQTEAQKANFAKAREALAVSRAKIKETGESRVFKPTKEHLQKMEKASEEADKLKELIPDVKITVKKTRGRPKGKVLLAGPTPMMSDDEDEDEPVPLPVIKETPTKRPVSAKPSIAISGKKTSVVFSEDALAAYMKKLNGF